MRGAAKLRAKIAKYNLNNVFNANGAAYFDMTVSWVSVCLGVAPALMVNKSRMTFLIDSNAMGTDKLCQLVLGSPKRRAGYRRSRTADTTSGPAKAG
ncbi:hypothetical protein PF010_g2383 [Phytophthora fragariae]|uniref:Uncharacterized protein n=1 Tax=Phytophthora fragariae TaxID=53985 RepID=A0A6A3MQL2_9STRA|nr:hypothetical protein PF011_g668 [Phytophthora fragariae]KAE9134651.1 hypothetical protein PF010_g2383 [Phytophthora fragariae]KAE9253882.1 hypothetical protein PF004_g1286 [Phytophthora fragariae]KAE9362265.1 hypothetical protein PF008_g239 [Phytophthora fragariae]